MTGNLMSASSGSLIKFYVQRACYMSLELPCHLAIIRLAGHQCSLVEYTNVDAMNLHLAEISCGITEGAQRMHSLRWIAPVGTRPASG